MNIKRTCQAFSLFNLFCFLPILYLVFCPSRGDTQELTTPHITITPSLTGEFFSTPRAYQSQSVFTLTQKDFEESGSRTVRDALERVPGVHLDQHSSGGGVTSVYLRGSEPNFTLVMIDGVKVNDPMNSRGGSFDFSSLSLEMVDRIEIVRGPLSLVYGSDPLAGVIHIITRGKESKEKNRVHYTLSNKRAADFGASISEEMSFGDSSLDMSYLENGDTRDESSLVAKNAHGNFNFNLEESRALHATLRYSEKDALMFPDDSGGVEQSVIREREKQDAREFSSAMEFTHSPASSFSYSLSASYFTRSDDIHSPGVAPGVRDPFGIPENKTANSLDRIQIAEKNLFVLSDTLQLVIGGDLQYESGESDGAVFFGEEELPANFSKNRYVGGFYQELSWSVSKSLIAYSGLRCDFPEDFSQTLLPRVGIVYHLSPTSDLHVQWGKGYKLPSFFALSHPIVGNPDLSPEESRGGEVSVSKSFFKEQATVELALFSTRYKNTIDLEEGPPPQLVNREKVSADGGELSVGVKLSSSVTISSYATFVETDIKGTSEELRSRPKWKAGGGVGYRPEAPYRIYLGALFVDEVLESSIPTGDLTLPSYTRLDLTTSWELSKEFLLHLVVRNILDKDYLTAVGAPAPGASVEVGITATF